MKRKMTSRAPVERLPLPIGNSDWAAVTEGYWSADKTQLISGLLDKKTTVALFTRPRRFGKTFALEMLHTFFERAEKSNAGLFKRTRVWQNPKHRAEQGRYPVLHITFKDAKGGDWGTVGGWQGPLTITVEARPGESYEEYLRRFRREYQHYCPNCDKPLSHYYNLGHHWYCDSCGYGKEPRTTDGEDRPLKAFTDAPPEKFTDEK